MQLNPIQLRRALALIQFAFIIGVLILMLTRPQVVNGILLATIVLIFSLTDQYLAKKVEKESGRCREPDAR
jgi:L-asparagine transporter-like permease